MRFWYIRICVKLCLNMNVPVPSLARGLYYGMYHYLRSYFACAGSEVSGETVCMRSYV